VGAPPLEQPDSGADKDEGDDRDDLTEEHDDVDFAVLLEVGGGVLASAEVVDHGLPSGHVGEDELGREGEGDDESVDDEEPEVVLGSMP